MSSSYSEESQSDSRSRSECGEDQPRRFKSKEVALEDSSSSSERTVYGEELGTQSSPRAEPIEPRRKMKEDKPRNPVPVQRQGRGGGRGKGKEKIKEGKSRSAVDAVEEYQSSIKDLSLVSSLQSDKLIPDDWSVAVAGKNARANTVKPGYFCMYLEMFFMGLGLPFAREIRRLLSAFNLVPAQLAPNAWRHLIAFILACLCSGRDSNPPAACLLLSVLPSKEEQLPILSPSSAVSW
jgi:hypothetical protein